MAAERFEAIIGASIKDFQRAMREVDREIRETAMGAEAAITADISEFMSEIAAVDSMLTELADEHNIDITSDVAEVISEIEAADQAINSLPSEVEIDIESSVAEVIAEVEAVDAALSSLPGEVDIDVETDVAGTIAEIAAVGAAAAALPNEVDIDVDADVAGAIAQIAAFDAAVSALPNNVEVDVDVDEDTLQKRFKRVQSSMDRFATSIRTVGEIAQYSSRGLLLMISPAIVPVIAHLIGVLGNLGVMLGVIAGSTFALVSAFAAAAIGILGFVAVAIPSIKAVHGEVEDMTKAQKKAYESLKVVKSTWKDIQDSVSDKAASAYGSALKAVAAILKGLKPMFIGVADAFNRLMESLNKSVGSPPVQKFFDYLNKEAGPLTETVLKSLGNLLQGFFSIMVAFGPLSKSTAQGFLEMSQRFADWSAGLSNSKAFQTFVSYVETNMPKIRAIFRDAIAGIIYLFAAFGPSASEWMNKLREMMTGFKEWARTLGENQQFQDFIAYVQENSPKVTALIGNLITFLKELGIALAPVGSQMLDVINKFLSWSAAMMNAHPWFGKLAAGMVVLAGAFIASLPIMITVGAFLGRQLILDMAKAVAGMIWTATKFIAQWIWIGAQALFHAAKVAAAWLLATGAAMARAAASMIATAAVFVAKWVVIGAKALLHAAKVAAAWALSTGAAMARAVASMIATAAVFVAKWVWMGVQALAQAARMAAAWFIALGPVGWVIGVVVALVILIIANWDKVSAWTKKAWSIVSQAVKDSWEKLKTATSAGAKFIWSMISNTFNNIVSFLKGLGSTFYNAGKGLIQQIINGIQSMVRKVTSTVSSIAGKIRDFLPFSPAKEGPLSDLDHLDFGGPIIDSINSARRNVNNAMSSLLSPPQLALNTSLKHDFKGSELRSVRHDFSADVNGYEREDKQPAIIQVFVGNKQIAEEVVDDINRINTKRSRLTDGYFGK